MILLSLDTSSRDASIAVRRDDDVLLEYNFTSRDNLSAVLIPSLEFILKALGMEMAEIDGYGIGIGPGLFTGIRIGMATMKGLVFAEKKPVVGVTSLMALAAKFAACDQNVIPLIDAKKGDVYLGGYRFDQGDALELFSPCLLKMADCVPLLEKIPDKIFVGSGAETHRDFLAARFGASRCLLRSNFLANEVGLIARRQFRNRHFLTDLQDLQPFYLRQPDAETNLGHSAGTGD
ncbi:MAG TPA: tRNA (adenosine(37)-N6)-threonylcarbamoyltransferase complex dimerization subunit type 1 TsaB [Candidatus Binatia bacterium]|nr:tRNA (adenosine(37)-N6)-threonylcarbamoyltransferase complex dimerization subunit type 1 TsaB [Candidatus Binatia bacterium]